MSSLYRQRTRRWGEDGASGHLTAFEELTVAGSRALIDPHHALFSYDLDEIIQVEIAGKSHASREREIDLRVFRNIARQAPKLGAD